MPYSSRHNRRNRHSILSIWLLLFSISLQAQVRWDGQAGDGQWNTAINWVGDIVPTSTDDVLLDNSIVAATYSVMLPGGTSTVRVRTLTISPSAGNNVTLTLPVASTVSSAFTATGPGYAITIDKGGLLLNSSGVSSSAAILVNDSIRINNGGQYTHNTRSAHAALVTVLSAQPGTEKGIFKFDPPGGGYTFASTNRTYGTLVLSAAAAGGSLIYASSAASPFNIKGDLIIEPGVTVNLDITAATVIHGNYQQQGGVFNLASQSNNNTVFIKGDFIQQAGSITETSTGLPAIELNGDANQHITATGTINNSVGFNINNTTGVTLATGLALPYKLKLLNGIVNTQSFTLTLLTNCSIIADSTNSNSFINGVLRKEGLSATPYFLFPVGKGNTQRWLELKNASGHYTVEFFKSDPHGLSAITGTGIHHISGIEYWRVQADDAPAPTASVELSFDNVNSGGVTDLNSLRVAQTFAGVWKDKGNTNFSGTAGSAGSVTSQLINIFSSNDNYFTLASSDAFQNPLPLALINLQVYQEANNINLHWTSISPGEISFFDIETSADGIHFTSIATIYPASDHQVYRYMDKDDSDNKKYYRIRQVQKEGEYFYSKIMGPYLIKKDFTGMKIVWVSPTSSMLLITALTKSETQINIVNNLGQLVFTKRIALQEGKNNIDLQAFNWPAGIYTVSAIINQQTYSQRLFIR